MLGEITMNKFKERIEEIRKSIGASATDTIYVCKECGSPDIEERRWVNVNTSTITETCGEEGVVFCNNCNKETKLVGLKEYAFPVATMKEALFINHILSMIEEVPLTGEQIEYILEKSGNKEQMIKQLGHQLVQDFRIEHRMAMIVDDVEELKSKPNNFNYDARDDIDTKLNNILIAADLTSDECYSWTLYKQPSYVVENSHLYHQCLGCKNPVLKTNAVGGCPTCGGTYFVAENAKDFSHLEQELPNNQKINV
jgi:rubrerythrin